jgi:hypothetical protein
MKTLSIIGAGRVGQTLGRLWARNGVFEIREVVNRSLESGSAAVAFMGAGRALPGLEQMSQADTVGFEAQLKFGTRSIECPGVSSLGKFQSGFIRTKQHLFAETTLTVLVIHSEGIVSDWLYGDDPYDLIRFKAGNLSVFLDVF